MKTTTSFFLILLLVILGSCNQSISFNDEELEIWRYLESDLLYQNEMERAIFENKVNSKLVKPDSIKSKKLLALQQERNLLIDKILFVRAEIIKQTGGYTDKNRMYKGSNENVFNLMYSQDKSLPNFGPQIKYFADNFAENVSSISGKNKKYLQMALDAKDDPCVYYGKDKRENFSYYNFKKPPMIVVMTKLSMLMLKVNRRTNEVADFIILGE